MPLEYLVLMMEGVAFKIHCLLSANCIIIIPRFESSLIVWLHPTVKCFLFNIISVSTKYIKKFQHTGTFILLLQQASLHSQSNIRSIPTEISTTLNKSCFEDANGIQFGLRSQLYDPWFVFGQSQRYRMKRTSYNHKVIYTYTHHVVQVLTVQKNYKCT